MKVKRLMTDACKALISILVTLYKNLLTDHCNDLQ